MIFLATARDISLSLNEIRMKDRTLSSPGRPLWTCIHSLCILFLRLMHKAWSEREFAVEGGLERNEERKKSHSPGEEENKTEGRANREKWFTDSSICHLLIFTRSKWHLQDESIVKVAFIRSHLSHCANNWRLIQAGCYCVSRPRVPVRATAAETACPFLSQGCSLYF